MHKFTYLTGAFLLMSAGCTERSPGGDTEPACSATADADSDGIDDCAEEELGTDPANDDSDGDGLTDAEELDCVSDPLDADEQCYACGWEHNDPGALVSEGRRKGDTMDSIELVDQCGEMVDLWDFHGEYHVLYMTAAW